MAELNCIRKSCDVQTARLGLFSFVCLAKAINLLQIGKGIKEKMRELNEKTERNKLTKQSKGIHIDCIGDNYNRVINFSTE